MVAAVILAGLCSDIYDDTKHWLHYWESDRIHVAHAKVADSDVLICRGAVDALGFLHAGVATDICNLLAETTGDVGAKVVIAGGALEAPERAYWRRCASPTACRLISYAPSAAPRRALRTSAG